MAKTMINWQSEFKLHECHLEMNGRTPFRFAYSTTGEEVFHASFDGTDYVNCRRDECGVIVIFDDHGLPPGDLYVTRRYYLTDTDFADGICHLVTRETTDVCLTRGQTSGTRAEVHVAPLWTKLRYEDLTEEDKADLLKDVYERMSVLESRVMVVPMTQEEYDGLMEAGGIASDVLYVIVDGEDVP